MKIIDITIEDHVVPQLLTSAIEAYEIKHDSGRKKINKVETFGLLWGYIVEGRSGQNPRIISTLATIETSALKRADHCQPMLDSLTMKRDFFKKYWPHIDLVGTFHSHPYDNLDEVRSNRGWQASTPDSLGDEDEGDTVFWPWIHENVCSDIPYLAHLIITITSLQKKGWAYPRRFDNCSGFELSSDYRKFWITSYATCLKNESFGMMKKTPNIDIPSLERRFLDKC